MRLFLFILLLAGCADKSNVYCPLRHEQYNGGKLLWYMPDYLAERGGIFANSVFIDSEKDTCPYSFYMSRLYNVQGKKEVQLKVCCRLQEGTFVMKAEQYRGKEKLQADSLQITRAVSPVDFCGFFKNEQNEKDSLFSYILKVPVKSGSKDLLFKIFGRGNVRLYLHDAGIPGYQTGNSIPSSSGIIKDYVGFDDSLVIPKQAKLIGFGESVQGSKEGINYALDFSRNCIAAGNLKLVMFDFPVLYGLLLDDYAKGKDSCLSPVIVNKQIREFAHFVRRYNQRNESGQVTITGIDVTYDLRLHPDYDNLLTKYLSDYGYHNPNDKRLFKILSGGVPKEVYRELSVCLSSYEYPFSVKRLLESLLIFYDRPEILWKMPAFFYNHQNRFMYEQVRKDISSFSLGYPAVLIGSLQHIGAYDERVILDSPYSLGYYLKKEYDSLYYSIGLYLGSGSVNPKVPVFNQYGNLFFENRIVTLDEPPVNSLEWFGKKSGKVLGVENDLNKMFSEYPVYYTRLLNKVYDKTAFRPSSVIGDVDAVVYLQQVTPAGDLFGGSKAR